MTVRSKLRKLLGADIGKVHQFYSLGLSGNRQKEMVVCPFHSDTMPSMLVDYDRNFCYCFSCQKSWDALEFVKQKDGIGVKKALLRLAEIVNLDVSQAELDEMCERMSGRKYTLSTEEADTIKEEKLRRLALNVIALEFGHRLGGRVPGWEIFGHYIDSVYDEFDEIMRQQMTIKKLDKIKDTARQRREWLLQLIPRLNEAYERMKREVQQERTGEFLGVAEDTALVDTEVRQDKQETS